MTVAELVDHIQSRFHRIEHHEMQRLDDLLRRTPPRLAPRLAAVGAAFTHLKDELEAHMEKEETVLFPWIRSGRGDLAHAPIQVMVMEHRETLELLNRVRTLTEALDASREPSGLVAEVATGLGRLDTHVREHMQLENEVLFPRALRGES
ncbi:MAG: hemerythrin domain-containing protein [bacterium]